MNLVTHVLLQHIGTFDEVHIQIPRHLYAKSQDLSSSIQFAFKRGVRRLSLSYCPVDLPACIYSSAELTHLKLQRSPNTFHPPAAFDGLRNLVSFELSSPLFSNDNEDVDKITNFISSCPKIKRISLCMDTDRNLRIHAPTLEYVAIHGFFRCICFQETGNVKELDVQFGDGSLVPEDIYCLTEECRMMNFFSCLVKLETLKLTCSAMQLLVSGGVPRELPRTLEQLKTLVVDVNLSKDDELGGLLCLLSSSPMLCQLAIYFSTFYLDRYVGEDNEYYIDLYKEAKFGSLQTVKVHLEGTWIDGKIICFLLSRCPNLETMFIHDSTPYVRRKVRRHPRASPKARVEFVGPCLRFKKCGCSTADLFCSCGQWV